MDIKKLFPVGSLFISKENINPAIQLGFGVWEKRNSFFTYKNQELGEKIKETNELPIHSFSLSNSCDEKKKKNNLIELYLFCRIE